MDWVQAVSNVGIPAASFFLAGWFIKYMYDKSTAMTENSFKSISDLASAVNHNTEVLTNLVNEIDDLNEKKGE